MAVVRPAITYRSAIWHSPSRTQDARKKKTVGKLAVIQNKCLQTVAGAYKTIPIKVLHAKTMVLPMQEYLDELQAKARVWLRVGGQTAFIKKQCKKIAEKLRKHGTATSTDMPERRKNQWMSSMIDETAMVTLPHKPRQPPPWVKKGEEYVKQIKSYRTSQRQNDALIKKTFCFQVANFLEIISKTS